MVFQGFVLDIIGEIRFLSGKYYFYMLVVIKYFIKWVDVKVYKNIILVI